MLIKMLIYRSNSFKHRGEVYLFYASLHKMDIYVRYKILDTVTAALVIMPAMILYTKEL